MTDKQAIQQQLNLDPVRLQRPLTRRTTALVSHAEALLAMPTAVWRVVPEGFRLKQTIEASLQELRNREEPFYKALSTRVGLIIRIQRLDRSCWDFLANARELLKPIIGREWSERWAELGFCDGSLRIPSESAARLHCLNCLVDYLSSHTDREDFSCSVTCANGRALVRELEALSDEEASCNAAVASATASLNGAAIAIRNAMAVLHRAIKATLRARDPRWLLSCSFVYEAKAMLGQKNSDPGPFRASVSGNRLAGSPIAHAQATGAHMAKQLASLSIFSALAWLLPPP